MATIEKISANKGAARARLVFVHGLNGHPRDTWQRENDNSTFWPAWMGEDIDRVDVYSATYDSSATRWLGEGWPLSDTAVEILADMEAEHFGKQPIVFVAHSLGGLLIKEMLRIGHTQGNSAWNAIAKNTRGVVFIATPHSGSHLADFVNSLGRIFNVTPNLRELQTSAENLKQLRNWYRDNAAAFGLQTYAFYERLQTRGRHVVTETSADPSISRVTPIGVSADHFTICKPATRKASVYKNTKHFIERILAETKAGWRESDGSGVTDGSVDLPASIMKTIRELKIGLATESEEEVIRRAVRLYARCFSGELKIVSQDGASKVIVDV